MQATVPGSRVAAADSDMRAAIGCHWWLVARRMGAEAAQQEYCRHVAGMKDGVKKYIFETGTKFFFVTKSGLFTWSHKSRDLALFLTK